MVPAHLTYDPDTDEVVFHIPSAEGEGDVVLTRIPVDTLSAEDNQRLRHIRVPEWRAGIAVEVGQEWKYDGTVYTVVQAHTTQADWTPPVVPALWSAV